VHVRVDPAGEHRVAAEVDRALTARRGGGECGDPAIGDLDACVANDAAAAVERVVGDDDERLL
jgi:hypothetical protein